MLQTANVERLTDYLRIAHEVGEQVFESVVDQLNDSSTTRQAAANYISEQLDHENLRRPRRRWSEPCIILLVRRLIGPSEAARLYDIALEWLSSKPVFQTKEPRRMAAGGMVVGVQYRDDDPRVMEHRLHVVRLMRVLNEQFPSQAPTAQRVRQATTWTLLVQATPELSLALDELIEELSQLERQADPQPAGRADRHQDLELSLGDSIADTEPSSDQR
jgi:hypothetical protein